MASNLIYDTLSNIEQQLKFLTKSEIRINILKCLKQKPYSINEIVRNTGMRYSSVSANMHKLEQNNNVYKQERKFKITSLTEMYLENILDFNRSLEIINNYGDFWHKHNIDELDYDSVKNLTEIYNSKLIKSTSLDIYKTYDIIKYQIMNSKNICAIFPYLHPEFPKIIEKELENGAKIELIVNYAIYKKLIFSMDRKIYQETLKNGNLKILPVKKELYIYLAICDESMSMGLFKNDESFDQNRILISYNEKAIKWGLNLFNDVKSRI